MARKKGKNINKKHGGHLAFKKSIRVKNRAKDIDQIQDEIKLQMKKLSQQQSIVHELDPDLPGMGQFYCISCARYFTDQFTLDEHKKSKLHKKRLKIVNEPEYTQEEAERAAGQTRRN